MTLQHSPSMDSRSRHSLPRWRASEQKLKTTVIPAGNAGIQWPGMGSTQHRHSQHPPSMDSRSRHSLPRWRAITQPPQYPSFQQGTLESSDQGWEVHNIYIPSTHPPWILDLGIPCQDDEQLHKYHNTRHSSRERGIQWPGTGSTQYLYFQHPPSMDSRSRQSLPRWRASEQKPKTTVIPAGNAGIQWPGMGSIQYRHSQHLPSMDSGSRHSLPRWRASEQKPKTTVIPAGNAGIQWPGTGSTQYLHPQHPPSMDSRSRQSLPRWRAITQPPQYPSFQQGALESSDQGWEAHNIYIPSTHPPWILDLGNPCQDDKQLHNTHNIRHSSRERGIQWPGMGSTQYLYPQHLPSMDSGSRQSLPRWRASEQKPKTTVIPAGSAGIQWPGMESRQHLHFQLSPSILLTITFTEITAIYNNSGQRSFHAELNCSIIEIFTFRPQRLICFSRKIALSIFPWTSYQTRSWTAYLLEKPSSKSLRCW